MGKILVLRVPAPHPLQRKIEECKAKRIVVVAGRRGGKTTMAARLACRNAAAGRRELYATPIYSQTDAFWELCVTWLWDAIQIGLVIKNETKRKLDFVRGRGRIVARTASRPDHLRGLYADDLFLDEYAYQDPEIWEKVGSPMLIDNDGTAYFISSPRKRNHFFLMALAAEENDDGRWAKFHFPSTANPHLSADALAEISKDLSAEDYEQEILAKFVEGEGAVFRLYREDFLPGVPRDKTNMAAWEKMVASHKGHRCVGGLDWGRRHDYTAFDVGCTTCSREIMLERYQAEDYPTQRDIIRGIYRQFKDLADVELELLSEENAMGLPNLEQLRADGVPINSLMVRNTEKAQLVQGLRLAFEQRTWKWMWHEAAWRELEGYEAKVTQQGHISYNAPEALHDDTIVARYLMLHQAKMGQFTRGSV